MKAYLIFCSCMILSMGAVCQKQTVIQGIIQNDTIAGQILLIRGTDPFPDSETFMIVDSSQITNGRFKFKFKPANAEIYTLRIKQTNNFTSVIALPGDKTKLTWSINRKESRIASSGSMENDQYVNKMINKGRPIIIDVNRFQDSAAMYKKLGDSVMSRYYSLQNQYWFDSLQKYYVYLAYDKPMLYSSLYTVAKLSKMFPDEYVKTYLDQLPGSLRDSELAKEIKYRRFTLPEELAQVKSFADFDFIDTSFRSFSYQPYLGKIVLIDFWASWCAPCIENFPKIDSLIAKVDKQEFAVIGVSLDDSNKAWLAGLRRLQPGWVNIRDTKAWKGKVVSYFDIKSIPRYVLLGKDGTVINDRLDRNTLEDYILKYVRD
ncbi:MAG: AhpC/TSA family protein [Chitinophagaceae bacterium]|nr:MAG: AhpC/TSA family protein [Chitinophagaceae bacterium]